MDCGGNIRILGPGEEPRSGESTISAKPGCRRCFGRGYIGCDAITLKPVLCRCIAKQARDQTQRRKKEGDKAGPEAKENE